jgi:cytochrome c oxidase subunit 2
MVVLMRRVFCLRRTGPWSFTIVLAAAVAVAASQGPPTPPAQAADGAVTTVEVTAERFAFQPSEIKIPAGTTLKVVLSSDDTTHGFRIKGQGVTVEIPKRGRGTITATFTPPKPGRYVFECSRICGAGHGFMRGTIVVTEPGATK